MCFGLVIGWMTCRVHKDAKPTDIKWLAAMIGTVGGGSITAIFGPGDSNLFGGYSIGLAIGFFFRPLFVRLGKSLGIESVN